MMNRHRPEKLNQEPQPAESEEFTLEEIIREFGSESPEPEPPEHVRRFRPARERKTEENPEPEEPRPKREKKKREKPTREQKRPEKQARRQRKKKKAAPAEAPAAPKTGGGVSDDTVVFRPIQAEKLPPRVEEPMKIASPGKLPAGRMPEKKKSSTSEPRPGRQERKTAREKKQTADIQECAPPSARQQLKSCRQGLSMRYLRIYLLSVLVLAGLFLLLYRECGWTFLPVTEKAGMWLPLGLLGLSVLLSWDVFVIAVADLFRLRIGLHTLTVIITVLTILETLTHPAQKGGSYCAVAALLLLFQLRALHADRVSRFHTLRAVCSFDSPMGIFDTCGAREKSDNLRRDTGKTEEFLEKLSARATPRKVLQIYSTVMLLLTLALAWLLSRREGTEFTEAWLLLLMGAVPCGAALTYVRPFSTIAKKLAEVHGALCGWHGAKIFGGKHTIVISDQDLFPLKNITNNGMKIYGNYKAHRIIAYGLAGLRVVDSPLTGLFESLLASQYGREVTPSQTRIYDGGGVGAEIDGDVVLVGSLPFMRSMGVHMPAGTRVRQAVYVSVDGELAGIFAVRYKPSNSTRAGLRTVLSNRNFSVILATRDFVISPELIAAKYELPTDAMKFPLYTKRLELADLAPRETEQQGALIARDTFGAFGVTVAAGRTLRLCTSTSLWLNLFAGILGFLLCAMLLMWNAVSVASPAHIAAFQLLWAFLSGFVTFVILRF